MIRAVRPPSRAAQPLQDVRIEDVWSSRSTRATLHMDRGYVEVEAHVLGDKKGIVDLRITVREKGGKEEESVVEIPVELMGGFATLVQHVVKVAVLDGTFPPEVLL